HLLDVAAQLARYGQCEISGEESSVTFNSDLYVPIGCGVTYLGGCLERDLCPLTDDFRCGKNGVGDQVKRDLGVCCLFRRKIKFTNRPLVSLNIGSHERLKVDEHVCEFEER